MKFKSFFVTVCQQALASALVVATAVAGAGVMRLDIERPGDLQVAVRTGKAYVETAPVVPTVVEVAVPAVASAAPARSRDSRGRLLAALSSTHKVKGFLTVGATWAPRSPLPEPAISLQVRSLTKGHWTKWEPLEYHNEHGPDVATKTSRPGTEPTVIGRVDEVQLRVFTKSGVAPKGLQLVLVDPGVGKVRTVRVGANTASPSKRVVLTAATTGVMPVAPKPSILTRADWGADESLRTGNPSYGTVQTGFVHHTVNANNYTKEQVPALLRSIYAYHVKGRGWSDIGYNYLVDRFGQIWEGRYGGIDKAVIGAHTLGYNEVGFAMSAIGNYDIAEPSEAIINAYAALFAWKLSIYNIPADRTGIVVKGHTLNAINGHRDTKATACPGRYLYARIPDIRAKAAAIQRGVKPTPTPTPTTITPVPENKLPARRNLVGSQWPDVLVHNAETGKVLIYPTDGQLGFTEPVVAAPRWSAAEKLSMAGDLNGDGIPDVVGYTPSTKALRVFVGEGNGYRALGKAVTTGAFSSIQSAGDFNRDGRPDLLAVGSTGLWLIPGAKAPFFTAPVRLAADWSSYSKTVTGDFNGDRAVDVLAVAKDGRVWGLPNRSGKLGARVTAKVTLTADVVLGGGDYTGDGQADLLVRDSSKGILIRPGLGGFSFGPALGPWGFATGLTGLSASRVSAGRMIVAGRRADGSLVSARTNGQRNVLAPIDTGIRIPNPAQLLSAGDWNRDGKADIVTRGVGGDTLMLRLGNGSGGFAPPRAMAWKFANVTRLAAVGDIDGDNNPDLVAQFGKLTKVYLGDGKVGVRKSVTAPAKLRTYNQIGRGLWASDSLPSSAFLSSDGSFVPRVGSSALGSGYDLVVGLGDVDGDGLSDLVAREKASGSLWLLPGSATGELGVRRLIGSGFGGVDRLG